MSAKYKQVIQKATAAYLGDYDYRLVAAQVRQESAFNPKAVSPAGARGILQVMPATWKEEIASMGKPYLDPFDIEDGLMVGCSYMAKRLKGWSSPRPEIDRICLALASYNAGFGNLLAAQKLAGGASDYASIIAKLSEVTGHHSAETIQYVEKILGYYNEYVTKGW